MLNIESLATSLEAEVNGIWRPLAEGARVKVARLGNDEYQKLLRRKHKSSKAVLEQEDDFAAQLSETLMIEIYAHTILKDVEGIAINGNLIEKYTPAIGIQLLGIKDFREKIADYAKDFNAYHEALENEAVKI